MRKNYLFFYCSFLSFLLTGLSTSAQTKIIPYQELPDYNGNATGSGIFLSASMTTSNITLTFEGPGDRWFALGLGTFMTPADLLMFGSGTSGTIVPAVWKDGYNSYTTDASIDASQDWTIISTATVASSGHRTVTASRALNTGDASDVAISYSAATLDVIWGRGATADYTVAYHGSTARRNGISLPFLSIPTASFSALSTTVCPGSSVSFTNLSTGGLTSYTWSFQGASSVVSTATNPSVTYSVPGTYSVSLTASNSLGSNTYSQTNYITVIPSVAPAISIFQSSGSNPVCSGTPVTFSATAVNGGSNPTYHWLVNGSPTGSNTATFSGSLSNNALITCVMIPNIACASPTSVTSGIISMSVNSSAPASIVTALTAGNNPMCLGGTTTFTATPGNGGNAPSYQWKVNGVNVGSNSYSYSTNGLQNGDVVTCVLNSNAPCASSTVATSSGITMTVSAVLAPFVSIGTVGNSNSFCAGSVISLTANPTNGGSAPSYQWLVNGVPSGSTLPQFNFSTLSGTNSIICIMHSNLGCSNPNTATSTALGLTVYPIPPSPSITAAPSNTFCQGDSIMLSSSSSLGNTWSNGSTNNSISVSSGGTFAVSQTINGCTSPASAPISVTVRPLPFVDLGGMDPVCISSGSVLLNLGIPPGGTYNGPGIAGGVLLPDVSGPGDFTMVYSYTDNQGCVNTASNSFRVDECLGIKEQNAANAGLSIYPNPGSGLFTIRSTEPVTALKVMDADGKQILKQYFHNELLITVDLSPFSPGLYTLEIVRKSSILRSKIMKTER